MATFETFDRELVLATQDMAPAAVSAELARFAKAELAKVIASGEGSPRYSRFVGGVEGAAEETVDAPGPIVYRFAWWGLIVMAALTELVKRSPVRSGRYARSFVVLADQQIVTEFETIPAEAEVVIFNAQPYTRKIEVGAMSMSVAPWHFETAQAALRRRFGAKGAFSIQTRFLNMGSGLHPLVPYRLRRPAQARRDRLTYPALVMNMVS